MGEQLRAVPGLERPMRRELLHSGVAAGSLARNCELLIRGQRCPTLVVAGAQ